MKVTTGPTTITNANKLVWFDTNSFYYSDVDQMDLDTNNETCIIKNVHQLVWMNTGGTNSSLRYGAVDIMTTLTSPLAPGMGTKVLANDSYEPSNIVTTSATAPKLIADTNKLVWVNVVGGATSLYYADVDTMTGNNSNGDINIMDDVSKYVYVTATGAGQKLSYGLIPKDVTIGSSFTVAA